MNRLVFYCSVLFLSLLFHNVSAQNLEIEDAVFESGYVGPVQVPRENVQKTNRLELPTGYRAMVEMGGGVYLWHIVCFGATTTHGYQFNQCVFLGGTLGVLCIPDKAVRPIVAADFRAYLGHDRRHKPWVGVTLGYPITDVSFGMRFAVNKRNAINIALHVGMSAQLKFGFEF